MPRMFGYDAANSTYDFNAYNANNEIYNIDTEAFETRVQDNWESYRIPGTEYAPGWYDAEAPEGTVMCVMCFHGLTYETSGAVWYEILIPTLAEITAASRGGGLLVFKPVIQDTSGTPISNAYVGIYQNGAEKAYRFTNGDGRAFWGTAEGFLVNSGTAYKVRIKADLHENFPEQDLLITADAETEYSLTPVQTPATVDPKAVMVLFEAAKFGITPGSTVTFHRANGTPLVVDGVSVPAQNAAPIPANGLTFIELMPSDVTPDEGYTFDGRYWISCPTHSYTSLNKTYVRIPSTPTGGFIRPVRVV